MLHGWHFFQCQHCVEDKGDRVSVAHGVCGPRYSKLGSTSSQEWGKLSGAQFLSLFINHLYFGFQTVKKEKKM